MGRNEAAQGTVPLLSIRNIYKSFGLNAVLKGISLDILPGEVLALIGGNGAGKSTLMKIVMGIYTCDSGQLAVRGEPVSVHRTSAALAHGIYMVPQEPLLFPNMTVEENILIGFSQSKAELHKELVSTMDEVGWHLDLDRKAGSLSIAEQQLVEILRGLLRHAQLLILDEPTSALTFDEVQSLFKCVTDLRSKGIGVIYITHRLAEVFEIATHVAIMRDGTITIQGPVSDFTREDLVKGLLPPNTEEAQGPGHTSAAPVDYTASPVLELQDFSGYGFSDVSLKVYPGEILGVAGVVGAGRTEMATTIFGMDKVLGGKVLLNGQDITGRKTQQVIRAGLEDHFMGKLSDIPMGCDCCYTNHMLAEQNDIENLAMLLGAAGANYILGVPTSDDVMLNYQTNAYHDVNAIREVLGLRPIPEFEAWLEKMGLSENGRLTKRAGDPTIFLQKGGRG